ncbi:MAG: inositol monophosphatase family protein [Desulfovibrionales bacterium]
MGQNMEQILKETLEAVALSGRIIQDDWEKPRTIRHKGRIDLVTQTDLDVEADLKSRLSAIVPDADFLAEETASDIRPGNRTWIIDPLDGTTNFAHQFPFVATSVALWVEDHVEFGVVHLPIMGETFWALRGHGAFCNEKRITVSPTSDLKQALVATGFPYQIEEYLDQILENLRNMLSRTQGVRRPGSAAIDLAYTACGRYDGFYESSLKPWDTAAGWLLVEEAGGMVSRFNEHIPYALGADSILASNGLIHAAMSSLLVE